MSGMLGQGTHLKVHRLALAYANIRLYIFSFIVSIRSIFWGKDMGVVLLFALCRVVSLVRWCNKLRLLRLHELFL